MDIKRKNDIFEMVLLSIFMTIILIQAVIPMLGYIPLGIMNATIIQVTVAIGAILLGRKKACMLGLFFGLTSMWKNTFMPNPTSFVFSPFVIGPSSIQGDFRSVIICLFPRIMVGLVAAYVYLLLRRMKKKNLALIFSGLLSSLTNTILVMSLIFILYGKEYAKATNKIVSSLPYIIIGIIGTQGILEAVVSSVLCLIIGNILLKALNK